MSLKYGTHLQKLDNKSREQSTSNLYTADKFFANLYFHIPQILYGPHTQIACTAQVQLAINNSIVY